MEFSRRMMDNDVRLNGNIKASYILLIDENGAKQGIVQTVKALAQARALGLDLVQVSNQTPTNINPVCKIMDYGKVLYHKQKSGKESKNHNDVTKEIIVAMNIGEHDLAVKHKKVLEFLDKSFKVKYVVKFKGVYRGPDKDAIDYLIKLLAQYIALATWENPSVNQGRVSVVLTPIAKK